MKKKIIFAIIADAGSLDTLLNNFEEADFPARHISIVMENTSVARKYAADNGPLKSVTFESLINKLTQLGLDNNTANMYYELLRKNAALIAIRVEPDVINAAEEMLKDYDAQNITVV